MQHRLIKRTKKMSDDTERIWWVVQEKILWWWRDCRETHMGCTGSELIEILRFNSYEKAKKYYDCKTETKPSVKETREEIIDENVR